MTGLTNTMAGCGDDEVGGVDVYENQVRPKRSTKPASCNGDDEPIGSRNRQGSIAPSHRAFPKPPKTSGAAVIVCSGDLANAYGRHGGASCCDTTSRPSNHTVSNTPRWILRHVPTPYRLLRDQAPQQFSVVYDATKTSSRLCALPTGAWLCGTADTCKEEKCFLQRWDT